MLTAAVLAFGALLLVAVPARLAAGDVFPGVAPRDLWTAEGEIDRGPYLYLGFCLMALKYNLERLVAGLLFHRSWSVLAHYLHAPSLDSDAFRGHDAAFLATMVGMSLPFIWTGVALTVRRLRSAGLPTALVALFFAPILNLIFFLVLAALPAAGGRPEDPPRFLDRLIPRSPLGSAALVVGGGGLVALLLVLFATKVLRGYGAGLFVGLPFCLGLAAALVHGYHAPRSWAECALVSCLSAVVAGLVLFAAAVEGVICLAMAAPLALPLALMGGTLGWLIQRGVPRHAHAALAALFLGLPALMGAESVDGVRDPVRPVSTSIEVAAPPAAVWRHVVSFSELPPPSHWIFKLGFAYPVRATIAGRGAGAVRHCEFTTGAFVEPITVWDEPRLLRFSVSSQPAPMTESSWFPDLHPTHLDGYLVSEGGQFLLEPLPGGRTRLTGTTWYRHEIRPAWYWRPWSDAIIHRIHERVLEHVKRLAEQV